MGTRTICVPATSPTWKHTECPPSPPPRKLNCPGRHRPRTPPTHIPQKNQTLLFHNGHPPKSNHATTEYQTSACSPTRGKAHVNQIITPDNDTTERPTLQEKDSFKRVHDTVATLGIPLRLWEWRMGMGRSGCGDGSPWSPAHKASSSCGELECPRQRCGLGFSTCNS